MEQGNFLSQKWVGMVLGCVLIGLLSGCIHVDCKGCCGGGGPGPEPPCRVMAHPQGEPGVVCRNPGLNNCDITNPNLKCTDVFEQGQHKCKCL